MNADNTYLFTYQYAGSSWEIQVVAQTLAEAKAKVLKMSEATYTGQLMMTIPVPKSWWKWWWG